MKNSVKGALLLIAGIALGWVLHAPVRLHQKYSTAVSDLTLTSPDGKSTVTKRLHVVAEQDDSDGRVSWSSPIPESGSMHKLTIVYANGFQSTFLATEESPGE